MRRTILSILAVLSLGAAACSGGDDDEPAAATTTTAAATTETTAAPSTTATSAPDEGDDGGDTAEAGPEQSVAQAIVVNEGDLPEGFVAGAVDETDQGVTGDEQLRECIDPGRLAEFDALGDTDTGDAESPQYQRQDQTAVAFIQAGATLWRSADEARRAYSIVAAPEFGTCLSTRLGELLSGLTAGPEIEVGEAVPSTLPPVSGAEETTGMRMILPLRAEGAQILTTMDLVFARQGRSVLLLLMVGAPQPLDPALTSRLLAAMAGRVPA